MAQQQVFGGAKMIKRYRDLPPWVQGVLFSVSPFLLALVIAALITAVQWWWVFR